MNTLSKISIIIGGLLIAGVAAAIIFTYHQRSSPGPNFSYDSSDTHDWYESHNGNLQAYATALGSNYQGNEPIEKLAVADFTVHHGEKGADKTPEDNCFVGFSYFDYPLDGGLKAAYDKYEESMKQKGNLESFASDKKALATYEGYKDYELKQYNFTIDGKPTLSGYQIGFINLTSAHIRIDGACQTANDLKLTIPILEAVTFKND